MEVDALMEQEVKEEEEEKEEIVSEEPESLFFMAPDHEKVRTSKHLDAQEC